MASRSNNTADHIAVAGYKVASMLARVAPASVLTGASAGVGSSLARAMKQNRAMVMRHLQRVDPSLTGKRLHVATQQAFVSYTRYYLETFRLPSQSTTQIAAGHQVEGFEHIERAASHGKGTILALPHMAGWEWSGRWLIDQGFQLTAVVERLENTELFEWFVNLRSRYGVNVIALTDDAGVAVGKALRDNHVVSLLCDRDIPKNGKRTGVQVQFFGETTTVPAGPAFFALRTGASLLPMATFFTPGANGHKAVIRPALVVERQGSLREDVARITQVLTTEIENLIRQAPEQWHLFQPNWPSDPGYEEATVA
ncbi:MAG: phosphatidylinositol mannoside acyltransferase [Actinobacteria bacterium]|nr:phosphatidylinositol mannoside acyltransferase [Actinomycetota bacterium]